MIESKKNTDIIHTLLGCFDAGRKAADCFRSFCPPSWRSYLSGFLTTADFARAFALTRRLLETRTSLQKQCRQRLFYPSLLLVLSLLGTILFCRYVFPAMIQMAAGFHSSTASLEMLQRLLELISFSMILIISAALPLMIYATGKNRIAHTYLKLDAIFPDNLWTAYTSIDFARFLLETIRTGIPTAQALTMLEQLSTSPLIATLAHRVKQSLKEGKKLNEAVCQRGLDPLLPRFLKLAIYAGSPIEMLEQYQTIALARYSARLNAVTISMQIAAYVSIGILVVLIYQILLMPINILGSL